MQEISFDWFKEIQLPQEQDWMIVGNSTLCVNLKIGIDQVEVFQAISTLGLVESIPQGKK